MAAPRSCGGRNGSGASPSCAVWRQTGLCCRAGLKQFQQTRIMARTARNVDIPSLGARSRGRRPEPASARCATPCGAAPSTRATRCRPHGCSPRRCKWRAAPSSMRMRSSSPKAFSIARRRGHAGRKRARARRAAARQRPRTACAAARRAYRPPSRPPPSRESPATARCRPCRSRSRCRSASPRPTTSGAGSATACARARGAPSGYADPQGALPRARRSPTTCAARARCAAMPTRS